MAMVAAGTTKVLGTTLKHRRLPTHRCARLLPVQASAPLAEI
jgi:hypothetical protein